MVTGDPGKGGFWGMPVFPVAKMRLVGVPWFGSPPFLLPEGAEGISTHSVLCFLQLIQDIARLRRRSLRHSRQLDFPKPYIAARFRSLPNHFVLGDMKHYDNFENRALEPGQRYVIFILAVLQEPEAVSVALPSSDACDPAVPIINQRQQLQEQLSCELPAGLLPPGILCNLLPPS